MPTDNLDLIYKARMRELDGEIRKLRRERLRLYWAVEGLRAQRTCLTWLWEFHESVKRAAIRLWNAGKKGES